MAHSSAQNSASLQAFHTWSQSVQARMEGITGPSFETRCHFIPQNNLKEYFERTGQLEGLLDTVLDSKARHAVDPNYIRQHYAQSFAILLCIGEGRMIENFQRCDSLRDQKLPHRSRPDDFPYTTPDRFEDFQKAQWQFCARSLEYGMNSHFKENDILPIILRERRGEGGSAIVYKIVIDEAYNKLHPYGPATSDSHSQHRNTFVLKTYHSTDEAEREYNAEHKAYMNLRLGTTSSPHIIAHYGGFVHGGIYNNILEYADKGNLEDFMRTTQPPNTIEDVLLFWNRLLDIISGVMFIHGMIKDNGSSTQYLIGQASRSQMTTQTLKLLGLAHTISQSVDIWSVGCILSEASVWACYGWKRVEEYRRQRSSEIENKKGPQGEHIFHFRRDLLDAVKNIHRTILDTAPASHHTTTRVLDQFVKEMLRHGARPSAKYLFEKSKELIQEEVWRFNVPPAWARLLLSDDDSAPTSPSSRRQSFPQRHYHLSASQNHKSNSTVPLGSLPPVAQVPHIQQNGTASYSAVPQNHEDSQEPQSPSFSEPPTLTLQEGHEWKRKKKAGQYAFLCGSENLTSLNERDHIFLIDNSDTMRQYKKDIASVISLLAYMLKGLDDDGLDIFFTQDLHKSSIKGISDMRGRLRRILQPHINRFGTMIQPPRKFGRQPSPQPQRPLSIYILTDAKYQPTDVEGLIRELVQSMQSHDLPKEHVAISFIRFGDDQACIDRLDRLDSGLGLKALGMDIIDHTYWNGNVWKMLLGPLNDWYDADP